MFERAIARQFLTTSTAKAINWEAIASQLMAYKENCYSSEYQLQVES